MASSPERTRLLDRFLSVSQQRRRQVLLAMRYDRDLWVMAASLVERNGAAAVGLAVGKIKSLHDAGDDDGAFVWADVLCAVTQLLQQPAKNQKLH
jgi:hypothetical protein